MWRYTWFKDILYILEQLPKNYKRDLTKNTSGGEIELKNV